MTDDTPTDPHGHEPPSEHPASRAAERFAHLVGVLLEPVRDELAQLRADLGLANGTARSVLHRVTDLEDRVAHLELAGAATERPSAYVDSAEPGGES